jgi:hypothetical protein
MDYLTPWVQLSGSLFHVFNGRFRLGEITNNGNSPIHNVMVTVHLYDGNSGLVGISTCCYTVPININPGHTATFDSFVISDQRHTSKLQIII